MTLIEDIKQQAKSLGKTIVLPEGCDDRVLEAAAIVQKEELANLIILGDPEKIKSHSLKLNLDLSKIKIVNPLNNPYKKEFASILFDLRKHKGLTLNQAEDLINQPCYLASMMVHQGVADGYVSGAVHTTADTLRPALQIIKTPNRETIASSFFVMVTPENSVYFFADCGFVKNPTDKELASIAIATADSAKSFGFNPKVAMLSFSTKGSAEDPLIDKVVSATSIVKQRRPDIIIDGELQLDAAIVPDVAKKKCPLSPVQGDANVLVFPDLQSGNIGYKLVQRFAHARAIGPVVQGLNKPVNDLSRGCSVEDIVDVVAITAISSK